jgi:hypothetical protein
MHVGFTIDSYHVYKKDWLPRVDNDFQIEIQEDNHQHAGFC